MFENSFVVVGTITSVDRIPAGVRIGLAGPGPIRSAACIEIHDSELAAIVLNPARGFKAQDVISARGQFQLDTATMHNVAIVARGGVTRIANASRSPVKTADRPAPLSIQAAMAPVIQKSEAPYRVDTAPMVASSAPGAGMFGGSAPHPVTASGMSTPADQEGDGPPPLPAGFPQDLDSEVFIDIPF